MAGISKTILIADDDIFVRSLVKEMLEGNTKVIEAKDGEETLKILSTQKIDLLILDITMPKINGLRILQMVRKVSAEKPHLPVILLTAKDSYDEKLQGLFCGADAYTTKPFNTQELKNTINKLLSEDYTPHVNYALSIIEILIKNKEGLTYNQIKKITSYEDKKLDFILNTMLQEKNIVFNTRTKKYQINFSQC